MAALREKITVQYFTIAANSQGTREETWLTHATAYAEVEHLSGNENFKAGMDVYDDVKSFQIPYVDGKNVTPRMRILYDGDYYWINSIEKEKRLWVKIRAIRNDDE